VQLHSKSCDGDEATSSCIYSKVKLQETLEKQYSQARSLRQLYSAFETTYDFADEFISAKQVADADWKTYMSILL
jgi:hypothetical protein